MSESNQHSGFRKRMAVVHEYAMLGAGVVKRRREEALTAENEMLGMYEGFQEQLETSEREWKAENEELALALNEEHTSLHALQEQLEALQRRLLRYGKHDSDCGDRSGDCTCGWDHAREASNPASSLPFRYGPT